MSALISSQINLGMTSGACPLLHDAGDSPLKFANVVGLDNALE